jgi:hypothetical protein
MKKREVHIRVWRGVVEVEQLPAGVRLVVTDYDVSGEEADLRDDEYGTYALSVHGDGRKQVVLSIRGGCSDVVSAPPDVLVRIDDDEP